MRPPEKAKHFLGKGKREKEQLTLTKCQNEGGQFTRRRRMLYSLAEEFNEARKQDYNVQHCLKKSIELQNVKGEGISKSTNPNAHLNHLRTIRLQWKGVFYQKEKEKLVIACSNTVYNPYTVMIHLENTSLTCIRKHESSKAFVLESRNPYIAIFHY